MYYDRSRPLVREAIIQILVDEPPANSSLRTKRNAVEAIKKINEGIGREQDFLKPDCTAPLTSVVSGDGSLVEAMEEIVGTMSEADRALVASDPVHGRPDKKWKHSLMALEDWFRRIPKSTPVDHDTESGAHIISMAGVDILAYSKHESGDLGLFCSHDYHSILISFHVIGLHLELLSLRCKVL